MNFIKLQNELINLDHVKSMFLNGTEISIRFVSLQISGYFYDTEEVAKRVFKNIEKIIKSIDIENLL